MSATKILVTGHRGFIGQHLVTELADHGYDVVGHDREEGDLEVPGVFEQSLRHHAPDHVIHLAAQVGRLFGEADFEHTIRSNAIMTTFVARACGAREIPVLFSSTSEVYGDHGKGICSETVPLFPGDADRLPHNLYGLSKRWSEEALRLYAPTGLKVVRLSMPYGPGAPPGRGRRALDTFLWQAIHRMPILVHRGSERSWCWVGDTVAGIRLVLERGADEVYNVGRDDQPVAMVDLARRACELAGAPHSLIKEIDPPPMQTVIKRLSTARLRGLGWTPMVELDDGLAEVFEWVRKFDAEGNYTERVAA